MFDNSIPFAVTNFANTARVNMPVIEIVFVFLVKKRVHKFYLWESNHKNKIRF